MTTAYLSSQILQFVAYALITLTYFAPKRKRQLLINMASNVAFVPAFVLLGGYVGAAACFVAIPRDVLSYMRGGGKPGVIEMSFWMAVVTAISIYTYNGAIAIIGYIATLTFVYSILQNDLFKYRVIGIASMTLWLVYNAMLNSIVGIAAQSILVVATIVGTIRWKKQNHGET